MGRFAGRVPGESTHLPAVAEKVLGHRRSLPPSRSDHRNDSGPIPGSGRNHGSVSHLDLLSSLVGGVVVAVALPDCPVPLP